MDVHTEAAFEFQLCAHLEGARDAIIARQIGASPVRARRRILDVVCIEPGPQFDARAQIGPTAIPDVLIRAEIPTGRARPVGRCLPVEPPHREAILDAGVTAGFIERERRGGRTLIRRTTAYPADWFGPILAVENKPDLGRPGALAEQLRFDLSLAVADAVVVATASTVTGVHLNRIPAPVGVWEFDATTGARTVHRDPEPLPVDAPAMVPTGRRSDHVPVQAVTPAQKRRVRRRLAERAYGRGWRRFPLVGCAHFRLDAAAAPRCAELATPIDPAHTCGEGCPLYTPAAPPRDVRRQVRAARTPWVADAAGFAREQSRIGEF
jgi:hypothetical protein